MIRPIKESEITLLRRMDAGDEEAFLVIYRRCQGPIYRFALHMSGSVGIAEDVTQEVFLSLIRESGRFDPSRGTLCGYLLGFGRNLLLRRFEKEKAFVPLPGSAAPGGLDPQENGQLAHLVVPPADLVRQETIGRVRRAVLSLPANYRETVVLCDLQEMTYEEAATILHCAIGTVRSRLHRGRSLLMAKLRDFRFPERILDPRADTASQAKSARSGR